MLSRHIASGYSMRRTAALSSIPSLKSHRIIQSRSPSSLRHHAVTRQLQPWRRGATPGVGANERHLATAVEDFRFDNMPYNHPPGSSIPTFHSPFNAYEIHAFNPSSPITIPEPGAPLPNTKMNVQGVPGEMEDMLSVFDACIRVGKLDRAATVLKRFNSMVNLTGEERITLNNQYLKASLNQMRNVPDRLQAEQLHKFYELHIRNRIPHTAETLACMLKASLLSERGPRLTRLVKRYMGMAPGQTGLLVLGMADILSDQDLAVITEICPTYNFATDESFDEDMLESGVESEAQSATTAQTTESDLENLKPTELADLVPTPQQGQGLATLKQGLSTLIGIEDIDISQLPETDQRDIQLQLERDSIGSAIHKWRHDNEILNKKGITTALGPSGDEGSLSRDLANWLEAMEIRIKEEFGLIEAAERKDKKNEADLLRCMYGPLIQQGDPPRLAAVTILSVLNLGAMFGVDKGLAVSKLITNIAKVVQEDIELHRKEQQEKQERKARKLSYKGKRGRRPKGETEVVEPVELLDNSEAQELLKANSRTSWSIQVKAQVGAVLLKMLMETAKITVVKKDPMTSEILSQSQTAFSHMQQPRNGKKVGVLHMNPHLTEKLKKQPVGDFLAKHLPMVVEPKPWEKFDKGGFLDSKTSFVRVKSGDIEQRLYTKAAIEAGNMKEVFKGLDVLGKTAWVINKEVFAVMTEAWNTGESIANFPPLDPKLHLPPEPDSSADPSVRGKWLRAVKLVENEISALHSQRCYMNLQLEIARAFRNQVLYFPHNVDYRGRAYPMPTYLNHMGADHTRAILKFAKGKELGERGLRWLKIHLANVYGFDKASFDEREAFANDHQADIIDSVTNPLKGNRWWLKAEDPWQCLSTCFELKAALDLPDPTKFVSQLPVHQDGTCNGLQHYAALGGDTWGAKQVNLHPGDRPADVYSAVANLVKEGIAKDAEADSPYAKALMDKITRKVVKQTVMTNVYGVTFSGAKKQVCKQIDALYPDLEKECGISHISLSTYVAKHIFKALATMFRGAHDIQYWLGEIGGRVCRALTTAQIQQIAEAYKEEGSAVPQGNKKAKKIPTTAKAAFEQLTSQFRSTVVWTTPLQMPVVQPYRKASIREIKTCIQTVNYPVSYQTDPVNRRKQLQGFPPNFIHSLDASHMLLSALQCHDYGLDFAAVHDSFWTHAADVDVMSNVLREAFIRIHEEDVVGRLAAEFKARHQGSIYLAHIDATSPVARKIKELRKSSKLSPTEELLLEHKRNQLKLSGNPWDLEAAKKIVTPAAVYEEMCASEEDLEIKEDTSDIGLGMIPEDEAILEDLVASTSQDKNAETDQTYDPSDNEPMEFHTTFFESKLMSENRRKDTPRSRHKLPIWLPLTIPDIPEKGDFDIKQLRESKYFFS